MNSAKRKVARRIVCTPDPVVRAATPAPRELLHPLEPVGGIVKIVAARSAALVPACRLIGKLGVAQQRFERMREAGVRHGIEDNGVPVNLDLYDLVRVL